LNGDTSRDYPLWSLSKHAEDDAAYVLRVRDATNWYDIQATFKFSS
jgi:hypothetical protein